MKTARQIMIAACIAGCASGVASADSVYVQDLGANGNVGRGVAVTLSNGLTFADGSTTGVLWAGQRTLLIDGVATNVFSAQLTGLKDDGWFDTLDAGDTAATLGVAKAEAVSRLFGAHRGGNLSGREETVAFQAMLWEIVYDYDGTDESLDMDSGSVTFGLLRDDDFAAFKSSALRDGSRPGVGLITSGTLNDSFRIVPLPSAAGLTMLGLLGAASVLRRRS